MPCSPPTVNGYGDFGDLAMMAAWYGLAPVLFHRPVSVGEAQDAYAAAAAALALAVPVSARSREGPSAHPTAPTTRRPAPGRRTGMVPDADQRCGGLRPLR